MYTTTVHFYAICPNALVGEKTTHVLFLPICCTNFINTTASLILQIELWGDIAWRSLVTAHSITDPVKEAFRLILKAQAKVKERPQVCRRGLRTQCKVQVVSSLPGGDEESLIR